ncbi:GNAT superfamily N-acetyltransferase [Actinoplanes campanulatus]|uniref:GNAT superfamily N-acetyltransferase n=1 Tax=Actinoplanes campanulatus TaxID=113559 RepID=A0A7W5FGQ2_9ACTN|nr:GNAT family N-acetyltransferase [Actinoplanes campanulatus]MBB3097660.1 GNAT superfamily N-acetyltransferase [Actinoplanes campanulatus]
MSAKQDDGISESIRLGRPDSQDRDAIGAAIQLGNAARSTLGHMPFSAYDSAADKGVLLLAYCDDLVVGYALYALARRRVRLSHLCVDPVWRGQGIARLLVEEISHRHHDHLGIAARCRRDYGLGEMWISLDFSQRGERPGRSTSGEPLIDWWRDHGHPNLLSADAETVLVRAAIDMNVLRDLTEDGRTNADESQALLAPHLVGLLEIVRTAALNTEIDRMDSDLRARCTDRAQSFPTVRSDHGLRGRIVDELRQHTRPLDPRDPKDGRDWLDLHHVADAIAAGLNVLVTNDRELTRIYGSVAERHGLRILRPADVVVHIDELAHAEAYRPASLQDTGYVERRLRSGENQSVEALRNSTTNERPKDLQASLKSLALSRAQRFGIYQPTGDLVAAYATLDEAGVLRVPLLRVANRPLADTLARQLLFRLRQQARQSRLAVIRIADSHLSSQIRLAAMNDGFHESDDGFFCYVIDFVGPASDVERVANSAARVAGIPEPVPLRSGMPTVAAAELERIWWPAKITDSELPTYLIPIQQSYSTQLLGVPGSILPRHEVLGLSREHVYYRSPGGTRPQAPARLLWYMSEGGHITQQPAGIIACSQLDAVVTAPVDELYDRFQHLGVWDRNTVQQAAREGIAQALRFTNTEIFPRAVPRHALRRIATEHGRPGNAPQQPTHIPAAMFAALYQEGRS